MISYVYWYIYIYMCVGVCLVLSSILFRLGCVDVWLRRVIVNPKIRVPIPSHFGFDTCVNAFWLLGYPLAIQLSYGEWSLFRVELLFVWAWILLSVCMNDQPNIAWHSWSLAALGVPPECSATWLCHKRAAAKRWPWTQSQCSSVFMVLNRCWLWNCCVFFNGWMASTILNQQLFWSSVDSLEAESTFLVMSAMSHVGATTMKADIKNFKTFGCKKVSVSLLLILIPMLAREIRVWVLEFLLLCSLERFFLNW